MCFLACLFLYLKEEREDGFKEDFSRGTSQRAASRANRLSGDSSESKASRRRASSTSIEAASIDIHEELMNVYQDGPDRLYERIQELIVEDEELLLYSLASLELDLNYETIGSALLDHYKENNLLSSGLDAFDIIEANPTLAAPLLHFFVAESWEENPEETFAWALEHGDYEGIHEGMYVLGRRQGESNSPSEKIPAVLESDLSIEVQAVFLDGVISEWINQDMDSALSYMLEVPPSPLIDRAIYSSLDKLAVLDPSAAMTWAEHIVDIDLSTSAVEEVSAMWERLDIVSFKEWQGER